MTHGNLGQKLCELLMLTISLDQVCEDADSEAWRSGFRDDAGQHSEMKTAAIPR